MNTMEPQQGLGIDRNAMVAALRQLRSGDFSVRLPHEGPHADAEIAALFNEVVALNQQITEEFERLSRVVGKEGRIEHRVKVSGATGGWALTLRAINELIDDMVQPTTEVARVIGAVAKGDLSQAMAVEIEGRALRGEFLRIGEVVNTMVEQLASFASEVTRVAREVGTEGKLGGQAQVRGVAGTWKDLTDNVNLMAANLTDQVRNIAEVTTAVALGDLSKKITVDVKGEILELKNTINTMVDQLNGFASEVTRVAREVGTEGKLGGQAQVPGVGGTWKDLTDNVNAMAANLTGQVRNIADVTTAVALGDLSKKITVDVKGEILELKNTINTMVDQLNSFASEVTRVAREVGTEGRLGGQAQVEGVGGTWKDLTDNVNLMAANLTGQVRNIAEVTTAVARGDLSKKITVEVRGEILELKNTINVMVDQLNSFASEVTRVAREVGTEGRLGGQARVEGVGGTWKDLTDNVNAMAGNLTGQVRNIAEVTTAVALGDLSKKITVDVKGEILELKNTINTMVDQLNGFASEVTRVAREVGTEGKLGGQAQVPGVGGTWKDLTDNVNAMAANLTGQVRNIADVTTAVALGDLSKKITVDVKGEILELKNTINTMVDQLNSFASEVTRVAREVGTEGKLGGQAQVRGVAGTWKDLTDNVNLMADNLTGQVRNIAEVTTAVARGDLSKKITVDVKGEILELKNTINTMVDQLNGFASEVTRVAREVGTEGKLGGQAQVPGVGGTWKDLTDNVNLMATNLTNQVRGIADVVTAVAQGNLKRKLTFDAKGEIAALAETINGMIETLSTFGDQVTNMAREVGVEGRLGGQARVPGAAGLWRDLTDNVNAMAANLTNQVRSIAEVATAVTKGDLTRSIAVEASGEMAALKDNINEMILNLKDQTLKNAQQDWLKTNLARFSRMLQGERDLATISNLIMSELAPLVNAQYGVFYVTSREQADTRLDLVASYGAESHAQLKKQFALREGLIGQAAADKRPIRLSKVPGDFIQIGSGLGQATPASINILPALFEDEVQAVIELASFEEFNETHHSFLNQLMETVGIVLNTIAATMRTESLLAQSQLLTQELQARQTELTRKQQELHATNEELQDKAQLLENEKRQVEAKNFEIEMARRAVEEKAEQLALTSKYKSEFLANMSHELRTPLNSLLILSKLLAENQQGNLNEKQTEFARTIHGAGTDLLNLINDILDLSKIESGTVTIDIGDMSMARLQQHLERTFRQLASEKGLLFVVDFDDALPASIRTDEKRLQQIMLNLLSNAFKFTSAGGVTLTARAATRGWSSSHPVLHEGVTALEISVSDTGIGIPPDKQKLIFEAFQQADGTTSRKYGGTGLGLSISREIARLLGGELQVRSVPNEGSTFTLFVPISLADAPVPLPAPVLATGSEPAPATYDIHDDRDDLKNHPFVLIVEDDPTFAGILLDLAHEAGLKGVISSAGAGTLAMVRKLRPNAITLDLGLADIDGFVLLDLLRHDPDTAGIPVHVISGKQQAEHALSLGASDVTEKPAERDRLFGLFERMAANARALPTKRRGNGAPKAARPGAMPELEGARILIVDDDIRNIYSLTSVLEAHKVDVVHAESGLDGIRILQTVQGIDAALIDIMMPDMDGYETIRQIRARPAIASIPLVAVTAKAMKGDRQKCLDAGASDYISKPVDIDLLQALLRVWIGRSRAGRRPAKSRVRAARVA
jgi:HAMP domain-containing protein/signal transduction histidine kinase/CheY-like chemotaxis protein